MSDTSLNYAGVKTEAIKTLQNLFEILEQNLPSEYDVDCDAESLIIDLNDGRQYLLSFHGVTQQIWLSSPLSGAHHYTLRPNGWVSTRDETMLYQVLSQELKTLCQRNILPL